MSEIGAGDMVMARALAALRAIGGLGVYDVPPFQAVTPYVVVEAGPESDWGFKGGTGRELRIAVTVWDQGERPMRLRAVSRAAEAAVEAIEGEGDGWQLVSFHFLRSRAVPPRAPAPSALTAATTDYRARLIALPG